MADAKKYITPKAILSYPNLIEPKADDRGALWYQCVLVFTPDQVPFLKDLKGGVMEAARAQFGEKAEQMFKDEEIKSPFRKDAKKKGYPEGSVFFSCKSKSPPGIVGTAPGRDGRPAKYTGELYPGLEVIASVRPYYYKQQGGGIAIGLGNIQVVGKGTRLDNRLPAEDEFEADANAAAAEADDFDSLL